MKSCNLIVQLLLLLLILFVSQVNTTIVDNYPSSFTIIDETNFKFNGTSQLVLNGYDIIQFISSTFSNGTFRIGNTSNLIISNCDFALSNVNLFALENIQHLSVNNVTYNGNQIIPTISAAGCFERQWIFALNLTGSYRFTQTFNFSIWNSNLNLLNSSAINILGINYGVADLPSKVVTFSKMDIQNTTLKYNDPLMFQNTTLNSYPWCEYRYPTSITIGGTRLHHASLVYVNYNNLDGNGATISILNNKATLQTETQNILSKNLHGSTDFIWDSMVHFRKMPFNMNVIVKNNTLKLVDNTLVDYTELIPPPIRTGHVLSSTNVSAIVQNYNIQLPIQKAYQYVARELIARHTGIFKSYSHDVQIEPDISDEFQGWDECHGTCRRGLCIYCHWVDMSTFGETFSSTVNGVCYRAQVFDDSTATHNCAHDTLKIRTPFSSYTTLMFSSRNRINQKLAVESESGILWPPAIHFNQNDSLVVTDAFRYTLDTNRALFDPVPQTYFTTHHPFLILPFFPNRTSTAEFLRSLTFRGVQFNIVTSENNRILFSTTKLGNAEIPLMYQNGFIMDEFIFESCIVSGGSTFTTFVQGSFFLNTLVRQLGYFSQVQGIDSLIFNGLTYSGMDLIVSPPLFTVHRVSIKTADFDNVQNGLISFSNVTTFTFENVNITNGNINSITNVFVQVLGTGSNDSMISIQNATFHPLPSLFPSLEIINNVYHISSFATLIFKNAAAPPVISVGLWYSNITNTPCDFHTFIMLQNINPQFQGFVYDYYCPSIGCAGVSCFNDLSLAPPECIVDRSVPATDLQYRIAYFHEVQQAIDGCLSYGTNLQVPIRKIRIKEDSFFNSNLIIKNRYPSESLILEAFTPAVNPVIVGNLHSIIPTSAGFSLTLRWLTFMNPTGYQSPSLSTADAYILTSSETKYLLDFSMEDCVFVAVQPITASLVPFSTDITILKTQIQSLVQIGVARPSIRSPNVVISVNMIMNGKSNITNTKFYGSLAFGFKQSKLMDLTQSSIYQVYGENHWGGFISVLSESDLSISNSTCIEFCGGLSNYQTLFSIVEVRFPTGINFQFLNNNFDIGLSPVSNPYVLSRLLFGVQYHGLLGQNLGYLSGLYVSGVSGSTWVDFKIRNTRIWKFPVGIRADIGNLTVLDYDIVGITSPLLSLFDVKYRPRRILLANYPSHPTNMISSTVHDILLGPPTLDSNPSDSDVCDAMCPFSTFDAHCYVSRGFSMVDIQHYDLLEIAVQNCPFPIIWIMDPIWNETFSTDFGSALRTSPQLTITFFGGGIYVGQIQYLQNCAPGMNYPTSVQFTDIIFVAELNFAGYQFDIIPVTPLCGLGMLNFTNIDFTPFKNSSILPTGAIRCSSCLVGSIILTTSNIIGKYQYGVYLDSPSLFQMTGSSIVGPITRAAILLAHPSGFSVNNSVIKCENPTPSYPASGCMTVIGSLQITGPMSINNLDIAANQVNQLILLDGVFWDTQQALTLPQLGILASHIVQNSGFASRIGINLQSNVVDIYVPCAPGTADPINWIAGNNTKITGNVMTAAFTDPGGVILNDFSTNVPLTSCVGSNNIQLTSTDQILAWVIILVIPISILGLCIAFPLQGLRWCMDEMDWYQEESPDQAHWVQFNEKMRNEKKKQ